MPAREYVTLKDYIVRIPTAKAVGIAKAGADPDAELEWLPRSLCQDGDSLDRGNVDLSVEMWKADEMGLDY